MAQITDNPPATVRADFEALGAALDLDVPARTDDNLLIATWNIRGFASLTREWTATGSASPTRDLRGLRAIIEVLSRFDVIAIQEVKGDLRALRDTLRFLGDGWGLLMTDVTMGDAGNDERIAYLFRRDRVVPSGLACEIVVPPEWLEEIDPGALTRQFVRTPYAVSFRRRAATFVLVSLHIDWADGDAAARVPELRAIARWMHQWANRTNAWNQSLIVLEDFNIDRQGSALWQAFTSTGLTVPAELNDAPRSVFADPAHPTQDKFYDQIAWFTDAANAPLLPMPLRSAGHFDFMPHVYSGTGLSRRSISYRVSDHYPLWAEFTV